MAKLNFKLLITGDITVKSGLHIGGSEVDLDIGGIDKEVIKVKQGSDKVPYIPGSSLKGKLRSLIARSKGYEYLMFKEAKDDAHSKDKRNLNYFKSSKNWDHDTMALLFAGHPFKAMVFAKGGGDVIEDERDSNTINENGKSVKLSKNTRLICRDSYLKHIESFNKEKDLEDKAENTISRIDGGANPRHIERVVKDTVFSLDMVLDVYEHDNAQALLETLDLGFQLLKKDYLGGGGTRGSGKVDITGLKAKKIVFNGDGSITPSPYTDYTFKSNTP